MDTKRKRGYNVDTFSYNFVDTLWIQNGNVDTLWIQNGALENVDTMWIQNGNVDTMWIQKWAKNG